ncbi:MAG: nucleotidyl transferase AbiEii/AbiGii toxin family protein [Petrimonas sp.]|jgi:predicted nucleotidyltransferase component of viral defense system|uniref:nucleotidyl transferase AbiEii/AbiGii toxin family protein n=1 Tax=Petrimonas sp. TaxID=2023866 RepID=UPI002AB1073A|nr:nucleotidyl transferase AbiEii/AbiGii toxin family protein [Paludibacter sp.]MDD4428921.1 nucleotidyl transferase AbiEii/AbiGii toxin family protein [Paludibacter sp.]MEA4978924.1 nucleotidyl transferase AbiEii/AbiGii toxin family protein [Petrimonas sp.]MEA5045399.1 nucleotidyl transferase AbiEii/AbiGii toxin family protein [Petrimonas sp.]
MKLHTDKKLFRDAVSITAQQMNIPTIYVEKDYWVTFALKSIFSEEIGADTIFKGGTSLAKCFKMINRFSEDVDLVVIRREGETDNKLKRKLKDVESAINGTLPEIEIQGLTHKVGMSRKTAHSYSKEFTGAYGQVRDAIVLEATWLGYYEPFTKQSINSFVGEMMNSAGQVEYVEKYEMQPFTVQVLEPIRTICEKIMSLVRFSYGDRPLDDLRNKIRHTYDLHQLLQLKEFSDFLHSSDFETMLLKVANDDVKSFRNNNQWLAHHPIQSLMFTELSTVWSQLETTYNGSFRDLVYGDFPSSDVVLQTLEKIRERMSAISWNIKP